MVCTHLWRSVLKAKPEKHYYKAITIRQPWASLIVHGLKRAENRSWPTNYTGQLLIHAAKTKPDPRAIIYCEKELGVKTMRRIALPTGLVIGVVNMLMCIHVPSLNDDDKFPVGVNKALECPFLEGPYIFALANAVKFKTPFEMAGKLGIYSVSEFDELLASKNINEIKKRGK